MDLGDLPNPHGLVSRDGNSISRRAAKLISRYVPRMPSPQSLVRLTKNRRTSDEQTSLSHPHRRSRRVVARLPRGQLRFGCTPGRCSGHPGCAPPRLAGLAEGGRRRGRRRRFPGHALGGAACDRPDRTHAATRRPVDELSGWVQCAQRRLLPRPQARAGRGGPEGRPGCPGRGGFLTIPGSPRGRRRLRQRAWRPRPRRS